MARMTSNSVRVPRSMALHPVKSSQRSSDAEYTSARAVTGSPRTCSGAM